MTTYLPRSAWTDTGPVEPPTALPGTVRGVAIHWPGDPGHIGTDQAAVARRLEGYRRFHVESRGWNDIAYQMAIDLAGRVWTLRGYDVVSAANGDQDVNHQYGAVLFLVGADDVPSPEMVQAFIDFRHGKWLKRFPDAVAVKGHRDVRPAGTDCPGPATYALIQNGRLSAAPTPPEDEMTEQDWDRLRRIVREEVAAVGSVTTDTVWQEDGTQGASHPIRFGTIWAGTRGKVLELSAKVDLILAKLG